MNKIQDLHIEKEILPLFNYSLNSFTKRKILDILNNPLKSKEEIIQRQNILKGFSENDNILDQYSYSPIYLNEVYNFLENENLDELSESKLKYRLFTSKQKKNQYLSRITLLILFFHRLESTYFLRLKLKLFPESYVGTLKGIQEFLSYFELSKYEYIIREKRLRNKHLFELTEKINHLKSNGLLSPFWKEFFLFESFLSIQKALTKHEFTFPEFVKKGIKLNDFYHPLVHEPVKNNFETQGNVILLNGPNMSGKSTFLKAISLCVYFAHLGLGIPASFGQVPFIEFFSIEINRRDDVLNGYSHFMTEVINLKEVVLKASNGTSSFAVFDELFSGTNIEDALEICKTTINGLHQFDQSYFFISTHIQELRNNTNNQTENFYIDCKLIENKPKFTYELKKGWSEVKVGRILFEKEGLNRLLKS